MAITFTKDNGDENEMAITLKVNNQSKADQVKALVTKTNKENPSPEDLADLRKFLDADSRLVEANRSRLVAYRLQYMLFVRSRDLLTDHILGKGPPECLGTFALRALDLERIDRPQGRVGAKAGFHSCNAPFERTECRRERV